MPPISNAPYRLYTNYLSSCSARLRIALNLKNIPFDPMFVNLANKEQHSASFASLNPSGTVPCLQTQDGSITITQSIAALEYLEETHPEVPLLPPTSDPVARAAVRELVEVIACDTQPLTTSRVQARVKALGGSGTDWAKKSSEAGLAAYEKRVVKTAGTYSCDDTITLADVCLVSAAWKALIFGVEVQNMYPMVWRIWQRMEMEDGVRRAHWKSQADCPVKLRQDPDEHGFTPGSFEG